MALRLSLLALLIASGLSAYQADNTERNKRDRDRTTVTPEKQGSSKADTEMVARIRRSITDNKSLSTNAHNVKIVVNEGHVWLRGPVANETEKNTVLAVAKEVAGEKNITSNLEITKGDK